MSDSPLPLETSDRVPKPPRRDAFPFGQASGIAAAHATANGRVKDEPATEPAGATDPAAVDGVVQATAPMPELNGSAVEHADAGPAIGLGPHDTPIAFDAAPTVPDAAPIVSDAATAVPDAAPEIGEPLPQLALQPAPPSASEPAPEAFAAEPAEPSEPPAGHVQPPADIVLEVSPIFSALDAAEKATEAQHAPMPVDEPVELPILLPHTAAPEDQPADAPPPLDAIHAVDAPAAAVEEPPPPEIDLSPAPTDEEPEPAPQLHDAAAKIAEEANATAEALESLKRLLNHKLPLLDAPPIPARAPPAIRPAAPPAIPTFQAPPQPVTPPPMLPLAPMMALAPLVEREPMPRPSGVGGFLAGFALSWVFGAMLYAYLTMG